MVKASDFESEDCRFESCVELYLLPIMASIDHFSVRIYKDAIQTFERIVSLFSTTNTLSMVVTCLTSDRELAGPYSTRKVIANYALIYHSNVE